jgi:hypothetical protein
MRVALVGLVPGGLVAVVSGPSFDLLSGYTAPGAFDSTRAGSAAPSPGGAGAPTPNPNAFGRRIC